MQNLKDVETLMQQVEYLVGSAASVSASKELPALSTFHPKVLDLLDAVSSAIFKDPLSKQYPDVLTFGFWCRKAALTQLKSEWEDGSLHLGRGLVFHVSPSNLPVIFAYSLVSGVLAGNANVVRVPSKDFWQVNYLCKHFQDLLDRTEFSDLAPYIACVRYDYQKSKATHEFSGMCDVRVVWGGDSSINQIRESSLSPHAFEVVFADRYSVSVINSDAWMECSTKSRQIKGFFNDTYLNDQNACSAPRIVLWMGDRVEEARADFWQLLEEMVRETYPLQGIQSVMKREAFYRLVEQHPELRLASDNNYIVRIWTPEIKSGLLDIFPGSGFFVESSSDDFHSLLPLLGPKCQTLAYFGVDPEAIAQWLRATGPIGVDRVVPIGQTLDFSLNWDGYDIIRTLSRKIPIVKPI